MNPGFINDREFGYALVIGNPIDGIQLFGPFETMEEAHEFGTSNFDEWWATVIYEGV